MSTLIDFLAQMPNPFAGAVVSEREVYAWAGDMPDVESIHRDARRALREGIARARRGFPHLCVIVGDAGDGKTHLLAWLRRQQQGDFVFVSVPPLPDPGEPFRHGLRHLVACLRRPDAPPGERSRGVMDSPLSRLIWGILYTQALDLLDAARDGSYDGPPEVPQLLRPLCEEAGGQRGVAAFASDAQPVWDRIEAGLQAYVLSLPAEASLDAMVRTVLLQYPYPDRRSLCAAWLAAEEVGEAELSRLSVRQAIDSEAGSRRLLTSLCRLAPAPVVMCFDQIEGISDRLREPGLRALSEVVREMHSQGGAACQVITCHAGIWPSLSDKLAPLLGSAMGTLHKVDLGPIEPAQVRDLCVARLALSFSGGPARPSATYPFEEGEILLAKDSCGLRNARQVLRHFEAEFERRRDALVQPEKEVNISTLPPPTTDEGMVDAAQKRAEAQTRGDFSEMLPGARAISVRAVLKELCDGLQRRPQTNRPGEQQVVGCDPILGGGLRLTLQLLEADPSAGGASPVRVRAAFDVSNAEAGPALFGAATRLGRQVSDGRAEVALLLRDAGLPIGSGVRISQQTLDTQLGPRGGILWLSADESIEMLAIERVLNAASAGELSVGPRVLSRAEVLALLLRRDRGLPRVLVQVLDRMRETAREVRAPVEIPRPPGGRSTMKLGITPLGPPDQVAFLTPAQVPQRPAASSPPSRTTPLRDGGGPAPARQTLLRLPAVPAQRGLTEQQVIGVIGERLIVEERMLARELGVSVDALPDLLAPLLQKGLLRITSRAGLRVVLRISS